MSTDAPAPTLRGMIYPLQAAIARNQHIAVAAHMAVDRAMRALHDGPANLDEHQRKNPDVVFPGWLLNTIGVHHRLRFHERYHTDESRCRWCGIAAAEARAELEAEDGEETT